MRLLLTGTNRDRHGLRLQAAWSATEKMWVVFLAGDGGWDSNGSPFLATVYRFTTDTQVNKFLNGVWP